MIHRAAGWLGAGNMPQAAALLPDFSSGCCARAMTLLIRYCLAGWRSSPCCAP
ncbi:Permeases of the major facilitator superfamily [Klebsiella pneumoniae IS10]|nr:Permeases of the major facilitator superfamily [Klebsiella pneumoniae IS10]